MAARLFKSDAGLMTVLPTAGWRYEGCAFLPPFQSRCAYAVSIWSPKNCYRISASMKLLSGRRVVRSRRAGVDVRTCEVARPVAEIRQGAIFGLRGGDGESFDCDSMGVTELDIGTRGAAAGLFNDDGGGLLVARGSAPFDAIKGSGGMDIAVCRPRNRDRAVVAEGTPLCWILRSWPKPGHRLASGLRANVDDDFKGRRWMEPVVVIVVIWFSVFLKWTTWHDARQAGVRSMSVVALVLSFSRVTDDQDVESRHGRRPDGRLRVRGAYVVADVHRPPVGRTDVISAAQLGHSGQLASASRSCWPSRRLAGWKACSIRRQPVPSWSPSNQRGR